MGIDGSRMRPHRPPCGRLKSTVDDGRTVVRGLRPPALDNLGLAAASRREKTVRNHVSKLFAKLHVTGRNLTNVMRRR
jgi:signal transduction histidine kinase